jgi:hypothetical protein
MTNFLQNYGVCLRPKNNSANFHLLALSFSKLTVAQLLTNSCFVRQLYLLKLSLCLQINGAADGKAPLALSEDL